MRWLILLCLFSTGLVAQSIDEIIESKVESSPPPHEGLAFLRRLTLVAGGRIPTLEEIQAFEKDRGPKRRERWVDRVLESESHVSHQYNYWADVLRINWRIRGNRLPHSGQNYVHWLKTQLRENRPFDEIVRALVGASGPLYAPGNGAVGYYLRDKGMPLDHMSNTMRIFAGQRMECAQCHDHPFDQWKQKDFFHLAAFTHSTFINRGARSEALLKLKGQFKGYRESGEKNVYENARTLRSLLTEGVSDTGRGVIALPEDYDYDDGDPGQVLSAQTPMGASVSVEPKLRGKDTEARRLRLKSYAPIDSRQVFAQWLTAPDHPSFTRVVVNRIWKQAFGRAITEPLDDLKNTSISQHPELEAHLVKRMRALNFDLRAFWREILISRTFSRQAVEVAPPLDEAYDFRAPLSRRLSAEMWWDSLVVLIKGPLVDRSMDRPDPFNHLYADLMENPNDLSREVDSMMDRFAHRHPRVLRSYAHAKSSILESDASEREKKELLQELDEALETEDSMVPKAIRALNLGDRLDSAGSTMMEEKTGRRFFRDQRRSELEGRVFGGHFVRTFGASDRQSIEGSTTIASIPQSLTMLNGALENRIMNRQSHLGQKMREPGSAMEKAETLFLALLTRRPSGDERVTIREDLKANPRQTLMDWLWVLLNSHEFRKV